MVQKEENDTGPCRNMIGYNQYNQGYNKLFTQVSTAVPRMHRRLCMAFVVSNGMCLIYGQDRENSYSNSVFSIVYN